MYLSRKSTKQKKKIIMFKTRMDLMSETMYYVNVVRAEKDQSRVIPESPVHWGQMERDPPATL